VVLRAEIIRISSFSIWIWTTKRTFHYKQLKFGIGTIEDIISAIYGIIGLN
jgi:hypothetical protein